MRNNIYLIELTKTIKTNFRYFAFSCFKLLLHNLKQNK